MNFSHLYGKAQGFCNRNCIICKLSRGYFVSVLSICIPTYNRASLLTKALAAIAEQLDATTASQVALIISDNASTDDTTSIVSNFKEGRSDVHVIYHRQTENLGADANMNTLFQLSVTPWMLILSDDDILMPGAVKLILNRIATQPNVVGIILNSKSFTHSIDENSPLNLPVKSEEYTFTDKNEVLQFLNTFITFISVLVFRREIVADRDYQNRIGTSFLQSYIFLDVIASGGSVAIINTPCVAVLSNNTGGYSFFKVFVTSFADLMTYASSIGFSEKIIQSVLVQHQRFIFQFIKLFKLRGSFGNLTPDYKDGIRRINTVYRSDFSFLLITNLLLRMPSAAVQFLYSIFQWVNGNRQRLFNFKKT